MKDPNEYEDDNNRNKDENTDDDFGLPEVNYRPIRDEDDQQDDNTYSAEDTSYYEAPDNSSEESYYPQQQDAEEQEQFERQFGNNKSNSNAAAILVVLAIVFLGLIGTGVWWFFFRESGETEIAGNTTQETIFEEPEPEVQPETEPEPEITEEPVAETPSEGNITMVDQRTGMYYVIVNSFFDGDMAMDYAKELSSSGINVRVISPQGKNKFHRVAVDQFDTYAAAQEKANELKATYGNETWAVKF